MRKVIFIMLLVIVSILTSFPLERSPVISNEKSIGKPKKEIVITKENSKKLLSFLFLYHQRLVSVPKGKQ